MSTIPGFLVIFKRDMYRTEGGLLESDFHAVSICTVIPCICMSPAGSLCEFPRTRPSRCPQGDALFPQRYQRRQLNPTHTITELGCTVPLHFHPTPAHVDRGTRHRYGRLQRVPAASVPFSNAHSGTRRCHSGFAARTNHASGLGHADNSTKARHRREPIGTRSAPVHHATRVPCQP